ncbi:Leucine-rich repeat transmembrane protein kinase [Prunus dulcis]|uniref:Leucine-rich repeat transmembrane protein kinase n=1 Tax=Prunus dulcis TaxID=3755 RepID=A0A5H2XXT4_PRUDU|nr:Leucine-rich repeat transmembrane protein kinase [Prunus dulcis]
MFPFGFRHGSSDTTTELDPKEVDLDTNNLKINCTEDCGHDKNSYCHIKEFSLTGAALTGFIPKEVGKLKHLETLDLSGNQLTGSIPDTLWNLSSLKELDLSMNQLNGSISELIKSLRNLTDL